MTDKTNPEKSPEDSPAVGQRDPALDRQRAPHELDAEETRRRQNPQVSGGKPQSQPDEKYPG